MANIFFRNEHKYFEFKELLEKNEIKLRLISEDLGKVYDDTRVN